MAWLSKVAQSFSGTQSICRFVEGHYSFCMLSCKFSYFGAPTRLVYLGVPNSSHTRENDGTFSLVFNNYSGKQFSGSSGDRRNSPSSRPWRAGYSKMTFEKFLFVTM